MSVPIEWIIDEMEKRGELKKEESEYLSKNGMLVDYKLIPK